MEPGSAFLSVLILCSAAGAGGRPALLWVEVPGARHEMVLSYSAAGQLRWLRAAGDREELRRLDPLQAAAVESLRSEIVRFPTPYIAAGRTGPPPEGPVLLSLDRSLRSEERWMEEDGSPSAGFLAGWHGSHDWRAMRRIAGVDGRLRWEEVEEFLSLSPEQNRAVRALATAPSHPLWRIRRTYEADKLFANAALYFGHTLDAPRLFLVQEIVRCFEEDLLPWTEAQLGPPVSVPGDEGDEIAAGRRFFLRRIRSSAPRIYGRIDRVLQSLEAEWGNDAVLVLDASRSPDPFLAVRAREEWPQTGSPPVDLRVLLRRLGWGAGPLP